jgi:hypothetical protein
LSLLFHAGTAATVWYVSQLPGCRAVRGEQIGDGGREVGIVVRESEVGDMADGGGAEIVEAQPQVESAEEPDSATVDSSPPTESPALTLPQPRKNPSIIGTGAPPSIVQELASKAGGRSIAERLAGTGQRGRGTGGGARAGDGTGQTSMFKVEARGRKFVYVIDRSSSMDAVLPAAKGELLASLQALDEQQKFQVVFFNNEPTALETRFGMFNGTEPQRLEVLSQLRTIAAEGGTERLPALLKALEFHPDVIYFLTDSSDPMSAADLEDVRRKNRSGAQIHCIEFGEGPAPFPSQRGPRNFLQKLADMTGGKYVYVDTLAATHP